MISGYVQGEAAARMALRLLQGETIANLPVLKESPNRYMFDYRAMQRFGIKLSDLPRDSIVIHKPVSSYSEHKALVWSVATAIAGLALLVFTLSINVVKRKKAEMELLKAKNELELKVEERTSELTILNQHLQREIAERKQAEKALARYATELEQSNRELQDFASIASHDLQEPLRKIIAFGDRLKAKYMEVLGDQGRDYLERMQKAAGRMQHLIEGLLQYSRITSKARPFEPTPLGAVVREVLVDLEERIVQSQGRVEVGELPTLDADRLQMGQLFQNLIGNALKFHKKGEAPLVQIKSQPLPDGFWEITVEDNGVGFDEKYLDRIFKPFQRLYGRGEFEGTGMGLAICHKIVTRHGGKITAKSAPEKGSRFIILLPAQPFNRQEVNHG